MIEVFDIVRVVSGILMLFGYVVMFAVLIYGLVQCFCVEDGQPDDSVYTVTQSLDEEQELESLAGLKESRDFLTGEPLSPMGPSDDDYDSVCGDFRSQTLGEDGSDKEAGYEIEQKPLKIDIPLLRPVELNVPYDSSKMLHHVKNGATTQKLVENRAIGTTP